MKIYDYKLAPNPRRVRVFLAEKGISVPFEEVDIFKGINRQPDFLKKNSLGGIPVLELDDGRHIAESVAICRYFELLHPEPALFGKGAFEQATVEMWNRRIELAVLVPVGLVWGHSHELTRARIKQIPEMGEQSRKVVEQRYQWLDRELYPAIPHLDGGLLEGALAEQCGLGMQQLEVAADGDALGDMAAVV